MSRFNLYRFNLSGLTMVAAICSLTLFSQAQGEVEELAKDQKNQFEIVDGTNEVEGEPGSTTSSARSKWQKACEIWKGETKDLNKMNQVVSMSCGSASCAYQENGTYICSSTAAYKLKIEGVRAPPAPTPPAVAQAPNKTETVVTIGPPQMITEVTPQPQVGFIWAPGYWGWSGHRHVWYPGHWRHERPGFIWVGNRWSRRGAGWHFESGHWDHHP